MDLKSSKLDELLKRLDRAEQGTARAMREDAEAKAEAEKAMQETAKGEDLGLRRIVCSCGS